MKPTLLINQSMLTEALAAWEQDHRDGKTMSKDEAAATTVDEVAAASAASLWRALAAKQPIPGHCSQSERLAVLESALRVLEESGTSPTTEAVIETAMTVLSKFAAFPDSAGRGCSGADKIYEYIRAFKSDSLVDPECRLR